MSVVTVDDVRQELRLSHGEDDALLQRLIDAAEDEAARYLGLDALPQRAAACPDCTSEGTPEPVSDGADLAPAVRSGIFLLVQAMYDARTGDEMEKVREVAFKMMRPYRCNWGV